MTRKTLRMFGKRKDRQTMKEIDYFGKEWRLNANDDIEMDGAPEVSIGDISPEKATYEQARRMGFLYAAAPDMLEALENRVAVACRRTCDENAGLHTGACDQARAAIAKAKGEG